MALTDDDKITLQRVMSIVADNLASSATFMVGAKRLDPKLNDLMRDLETLQVNVADYRFEALGDRQA